MPEISVIVPVYKVEQYLRRCVDSILAQTFTNIEVILVDDGSPDSCPAICDEYAQQDNRVKVIHQENRGVSAARNAGLDWVFANSDSQWISFVDSDDWVHPLFLEYLHRAAVGNSVSVSACEYSREKHEDISYTASKISSLQFYEMTGKYLLFTVMWNKLYRRELFFNVRFPLVSVSEDTFVCHRILYQCEQIMFLPIPLYLYYLNSDSITQTLYSPKSLIEITATWEQLKFFEENRAKEWEKPCFERLLFAYKTHIGECEKRPELHGYIPKLKREFQSILRKKRRMLFRDNMWIYEEAYPRCMGLYWKVKRLKELIGTKGLIHTASRIAARLRKTE